MAAPTYTIEPVESAPYGQISYVAWLSDRSEALVVDPGFDPDAILAVLRQERLTLVAILNTHGHVDHIAGNAAVKKAFPSAPLVIGRNEAEMLTSSRANLSTMSGEPVISPPADVLVDDGERITYAGFTFEVREIPGHSPGSVVFVCDQFDPPFVFGGDVLFAGSVGRHDFPGGSASTLYSGIKTKLLSLPDGTTVLPGHGPPTTVGIERVSNPYVGRNAGPYGAT